MGMHQNSFTPLFLAACKYACMAEPLQEIILSFISIPSRQRERRLDLFLKAINILASVHNGLSDNRAQRDELNVQLCCREIMFH